MQLVPNSMFCAAAGPMLAWAACSAAETTPAPPALTACPESERYEERVFGGDIDYTAGGCSLIDAEIVSLNGVCDPAHVVTGQYLFNLIMPPGAASIALPLEPYWFEKGANGHRRRTYALAVRPDRSELILVGGTIEVVESAGDRVTLQAEPEYLCPWGRDVGPGGLERCEPGFPLTYEAVGPVLRTPEACDAIAAWEEDGMVTAEGQCVRPARGRIEFECAEAGGTSE